MTVVGVIVLRTAPGPTSGNVGVTEYVNVQAFEQCIMVGGVVVKSFSATITTDAGTRMVTAASSRAPLDQPFRLSRWCRWWRVPELGTVLDGGRPPCYGAACGDA